MKNTFIKAELNKLGIEAIKLSPVSLRFLLFTSLRGLSAFKAFIEVANSRTLSKLWF
jgi:hypothetical protein